jgi:phosphatidylinositol alpha-mannosyltransferase
VWLCCYGRGSGPEPEGLRVLRAPRALSPRSARAGPRARKPLADAALCGLLVAAARRERLDALLAHNAEAACLALCARPLARVPVVYVVHTLVEEELPSYAPRRLGGALRSLGRRLDLGLARRADAVLALSSGAAARLAAAPPRRLAVIPPGCDPAPPPAPAEIARACARHGLTAGGFALYTGNLDAYQELATLDAAAGLLPELPVVAATQAAEPHRFRHLRVARVADAAETRALLQAAAVAVAPRGPHGGFPIKLLNYMEAARAIVVRAGVVDSLRHGESAWLLPPDAGPAAFAAALAALARDPARAAALGAGARAALQREHGWPELARRTLELVRAALS